MMEQSVSLTPTKEITFRPTAEKQSVVLELRNDWNKEVMFKLKTTRSGYFKMRPVFGKISANSVTMIKLVFIGFADGVIPARRTDRFTVLMIPTPAGAVDPVKVWSVGKEMERTATRKVLQIKFKDNAPATAVYPKSDPPKTNEKEKAEAPRDEKDPKVTNLAQTATRTASFSSKDDKRDNPVDDLLSASALPNVQQTEPKPKPQTITTTSRPPTPNTVSPKPKADLKPVIASGRVGIRNACAVPAKGQDSSCSTCTSDSSDDSESE